MNSVQTGVYQQDRRRVRRFDCELDLMVLRIGYREINLPAKTKNISRFGLCFKAKGLKHIHEHEEADFMIKLPVDGTFYPLKGEIIWDMKEGEEVCAGVLIREMDPVAKADILNYAYDRWLSRQRSI